MLIEKNKLELYWKSAPKEFSSDENRVLIRKICRVQSSNHLMVFMCCFITPGLEDGSVHKVLAMQAWRPEFKFSELR